MWALVFAWRGVVNQFVPLTTQDILKDALSPTPAALTERSPNGDEEYRRQVGV